MKEKPLPTPTPQEQSVPDKVHSARLITATRLPPQRTRILKAQVERLDCQAIMKEAILEPDGELHVTIPIQLYASLPIPRE